MKQLQGGHLQTLKFHHPVNISQQQEMNIRILQYKVYNGAQATTYLAGQP